MRVVRYGHPSTALRDIRVIRLIRGENLSDQKS
jgi:hypothetical protein